MNRPAAICQLAALLLLILATALTTSGAGFFGLDLLVGLLLAGTLGLAQAALLAGGPRGWGLALSLLAALGLVFHLLLNLGWL